MINDNFKKINQILEIVKIMQQERSGAFLVLLSMDTDIPPVDCRLLLFSFFFRFCFFGVWFCLFFICFLFLLFPFCLFYFLFLFIPFFLLNWGD